MKKLILLVLVAMVPYFTLAQKRTKKGSKKSEKVVKTNATYEFMTITGYEIVINQDKKIGLNQVLTPQDKVKRLLTSKSKLIVKFDLGRVLNDEESTELNEQPFKTMVGAVNAAANKGWVFHSSNIVSEGDVKIHYYYMRRDK
ncbi:MAG: hypothetical protein CMD16_03660 [Flavobacteriales bacterium]|nr:hypothetical protein [Flavobacteriales bacterium]|tara:strand:+ start:947 stop:1375 length:429 start_codon:yes stop_codon:yes gene_type:complete